MNQINNILSKHKFYYLEIIFLFACMSFCLCSWDLIVIVDWSRIFLDCFFSNSLRDYANILNQGNYTANYHFISIFLISIWLLPCYLFIKILHIIKSLSLESDLIIFAAWFKILLVGVAFLTGKIIYSILEKFNVKKDSAFFHLLIFLSSSSILFASIAIGQIDAIGNLFCLLGLIEFLNKKDNKMNLFWGLSLIIKGFSIMIIIPILLLHFYGNKYKTVKNFFIIIIYPLIGNLITDIIVPGYNGIKIFSNGKDRFNFFGNLFTTTLNNNSIFIMFTVIICGICLWLSFSKINIPEFDILIPAIELTGFYTLNYIHIQWIVYGISFFILLLAVLKEKLLYLIYFGINLTFFCNFKTDIYTSNGMINYSIFSRIIRKKYEGHVYIKDYVNTINEYIYPFFTAVFWGLWILFVLISVATTVIKHLQAKNQIILPIQVGDMEDKRFPDFKFLICNQLTVIGFLIISILMLFIIK